VDGGEDDACGGQGGEGQEGHRLGVGGDVAERAQGRVRGEPAGQAAPGLRMVVYTPVDAATRTAMEQLVTADPGVHRFPCWQAHQARARDLLPQPG
jgi:hypothetical protein